MILSKLQIFVDFRLRQLRDIRIQHKAWAFFMFAVIIGELCNFVAYAFTIAILVTPLGALSVVIRFVFIITMEPSV
jgi:CBS-domain-containing membrane protein